MNLHLVVWLWECTLWLWLWHVEWIWCHIPEHFLGLNVRYQRTYWNGCHVLTHYLWLDDTIWLINCLGMDSMRGPLTSHVCALFRIWNGTLLLKRHLILCILDINVFTLMWLFIRVSLTRTVVWFNLYIVVVY